MTRARELAFFFQTCGQGCRRRAFPALFASTERQIRSNTAAAFFGFVWFSSCILRHRSLHSLLCLLCSWVHVNGGDRGWWVWPASRHRSKCTTKGLLTSRSLHPPLQVLYCSSDVLGVPLFALMEIRQIFLHQLRNPVLRSRRKQAELGLEWRKCVIFGLLCIRQEVVNFRRQGCDLFWTKHDISPTYIPWSPPLVLFVMMLTVSIT